MEIQVNNLKKTSRINQLANGTVFRFSDGSDYWLTTDELQSGFRQCVRLNDGVSDELPSTTEVYVVKAKLEVDE